MTGAPRYSCYDFLREESKLKSFRMVADSAFLIAACFLVVIAVATMTVHVWGWNSATVASWGQAVGSIAAIIGAYGVIFVQDRLGEKHNAKRREAVRSAIVEIATKSRALTNEIYDPRDVFEQVGTWDQYRAFRGRQLREYRDLVAALPGQDIADIGLLDVAMKLRINLLDMAAIVEESNFNSSDGWIKSRRMITYCKPNFDTIAEKLGISTANSAIDYAALHKEANESDDITF